MKDIKEDKLQKNEEILSGIENILINIIKVNPILVCEKNYDEPFSGKIFNLKGRDILYIFNEVEKRFKISINVNDILNYEFNSINGIKKIIKSVS